MFMTYLFKNKFKIQIKFVLYVLTQKLFNY